MNSLTALVIDDDPTALSLIKRILHRRNYEVKTYADPFDSPLHQCTACPCSLQARCPDLIISDFNMPRVNGVQLLESSMNKGCHCRHLALISGENFPETALIQMAKYGTRFFAKPLRIDDFYSWLDRVELDVSIAQSL